jgi:hypothetical protein
MGKTMVSALLVMAISAFLCSCSAEDAIRTVDARITPRLENYLTSYCELHETRYLCGKAMPSDDDCNWCYCSCEISGIGRMCTAMGCEGKQRDAQVLDLNVQQ